MTVQRTVERHGSMTRFSTMSEHGSYPCLNCDSENHEAVQICYDCFILCSDIVLNCDRAQLTVF